MKRIIIMITCLCLCLICVACTNTKPQETALNETQESTVPNESDKDMPSETQNTEEIKTDDSPTELTWDTYLNYESFKNGEMNTAAIPVPNASFTTEYKGGGRIGFYTDAEGNSYKIMIIAEDEETKEAPDDKLSLYLEQFNIIEQHYYDFYFHRLHIIRQSETQTINGREFQHFAVNHTFFIGEEDIVEEYGAIYVAKTSNDAEVVWMVSTQVPNDETANEIVEAMAKIMAEGFTEVE